ncbi:MAG: ABC transporter substrate-binding protein, partial [Bacteroidales bacterium]|nr:ABC transporter substrate-binding protein [Bacteroidales bacterium]
MDKEGVRWAEWFDIVQDAKGGESLVVMSPYDGTSDTLKVSSPMTKFICMSSSYIAYLDAFGEDSLVVGVSGIDYISDPDILERYRNGKVFDVGYDSNPDYERILSLSPDLLICYMVSSVEPPFLSKLRSLGIPVLVIYEHLENHPLARAEYVKLFGYLTGKEETAEKAFTEVEQRYLAVRDSVKGRTPSKALLNIPYGDQWFIPGGDNYMSVLIQDAGGEVLGAVSGETSSSVISMEKAFVMSQEADYWLNTGWCDTKEQLLSVDP